MHPENQTLLSTQDSGDLLSYDETHIDHIISTRFSVSGVFVLRDLHDLDNSEIIMNELFLHHLG